MHPLAAIMNTIIKTSMNESQWDTFSQVMAAKYKLAMQVWAESKMGKNRYKYVEHAWEDWLLQLLLVGGLRALEDGNFFQLLEQMRLTIPLRLRKEELFQINGLDLAKVAEEYQTVLDRIQKIKRKKWRNPANHRITLVENLPGITKNHAERYVSMKASQIALDYVSRKYKLPIRGEAIKKRLAPLRDREKMETAVWRDLFKRHT